MKNNKQLTRCEWSETTPFTIAYHDTVWGVPLHKDRSLFEFLTLEGAQAGLNWDLILKKQEHYKEAFSHFDIGYVARYTKRDVRRLMQDAGIIRNRLKIESTINNAKRFLEAQEEFGSFNTFIWQFVDSKPMHNSFKTFKQIPVNTNISDTMSKDLKKRGFKFVGTTICYSFMQATGMVNDHTTDCFRYKELSH